MLRSLGKSGRGESERRRKDRRFRHRARRLSLETLERRQLLAIVWANQGSDNFNTFYGVDAPDARAIVERAFEDWNRVVDVNWDGDENPLTNPSGNLNITVNAQTFSDGTRGVTQNLVFDGQGRPISASIALDNNGGGSGWYFGVDDDHLFSALATPFHGTMPGSGSENDFYRTFLHEMGHAAGILLGGSAAINSFLGAVGTDQVDDESQLWQFVNPAGDFGVRATLTENGGGHFYEGPVDPLFPGAPTHQNELLNAGRTVTPPPTTRQLISDLTVQVLADAYGYDIMLPSQVDTLHVTTDPATSQVFIRGLQGSAPENFRLRRAVTDIDVRVNSTRELVSFAGISSITVNGEAGDDTAHFDLSAGDVIPAGGATFSGGTGTDTISAVGSGTFTLANASLTTPLGTVALSSIERGNLTGGTGNDTLSASGFSGPVTLSGDAGNDSLRGGASNDTLVGGLGDDAYIFDTDTALGIDTITESATGGIDTLSFSTTTTRSVTANLANPAAQVVNAGLTLILGSSTSVENIIGGSLGDILLGNTLANALTGGGGNDTLTGAAGNDTYYFDTDLALGIDTIDESAGGADTLNFSATTTRTVTVNLATAAAQVVNAGLTLILGSGSTIENVVGGSLGDTLTGNTLANTFTGRGGNDTMTGAAGNDTYVFDTDSALGTDTLNESGGGTDTLDFSGTTTRSVAVDLSNAAAQIVNAGLTLVLGSGATMNNVIGGSLGDTLTGNALANTLTGGGGSDLLTGAGGSDTLIGGTGNDTYIFDTDLALGTDTLDESGGGTDTLDFSLTTARSVTVNLASAAAQVVNTGLTLVLGSDATVENVIGGNLGDTLTGNALANALTGGGGNDTLTGAAGNDTLTGGTGDDRYVFENVPIGGGSLGSDYVSESSNILSLNGTDTLDFFTGMNRAVNINLGTTATQVVNEFLTLRLSDAAAIENVDGTYYNDVIRGNVLDNSFYASDGDDTLYGLDGNDTLNGSWHNDTLDGGGGNDTLIGAAGDDIYVFDTDLALGTDTVNESGTGVDTLNFSATTTRSVAVNLATATAQVVNAGLTLVLGSGSTVENATGGSLGDTLTGNSLNNSLIGGAGDDTYVFDTDLALGTDTLNESGGGTDTLNFGYTATRGVAVNLATAAAQVVNAGLTLILGSGSTFNNVIGGSQADILVGNSLANTLTGAGGNDTLTGAAGNDTLIGGSGNDTYLFDTDGALGTDTLDESGGGTDTLDFGLTTTRSVAISLASAVAQVLNAGLTLNLQSGATVENVVGGSLGDTLTGNALANTFTGRGGNDTMTGAAGNDTYVFDTDSALGIDTLDESGGGTDTLDFSATTTRSVVVNLANAAAQVVNAGLTLTLGSSGTVENILGGNLGDTLIGNSLANTFAGGGGNDALTGGSGNDTYLFDTDLALGTDTLNELGGGTDTLDFSATSTRSVTVNLANAGAQVVNAGLTLILGSGATFNNAIGGSQDDTLTGNGLANTLTGGGGHDTLNGEGGNDTLNGGTGNDRLYGGTGVDTLNGESGNDGLFGGVGSQDVLNGGTGADRYLEFETEESVVGVEGIDARIPFRNNTGAWTDDEVITVDQALAILHDATDDTTLLKRSAGAQTTFNRNSGSDVGYNSDGNIYLTDMVMDGTALWAIGYALHELGHNWDNFGSEVESPIEASFLALSGWTQTNPNNAAYTMITRYGETWWYLTASPFASDYAKTHPVEDFSESFAAYFLQRVGMDWYSWDGLGASAIPDKINLIHSWIITV